jgi:hypothetical protein
MTLVWEVKRRRQWTYTLSEYFWRESLKKSGRHKLRGIFLKSNKSLHVNMLNRKSRIEGYLKTTRKTRDQWWRKPRGKQDDLGSKALLEEQLETGQTDFPQKAEMRWWDEADNRCITILWDRVKDFIFDTSISSVKCKKSSSDESYGRVKRSLRKVRK